MVVSLVREFLPKSTYKFRFRNYTTICPENYVLEGVFVQLVWRQSLGSQGSTLPMPTLPRGNKTWWPDFRGAGVAFGVPLNSHECPSLGLETLGGSDSIFRQAMEKGMSLGKTYHFEITPPHRSDSCGLKNPGSQWVNSLFLDIWRETVFHLHDFHWFSTVSTGPPRFHRHGISAVSFFLLARQVSLKPFFYFMIPHGSVINHARNGTRIIWVVPLLYIFSRASQRKPSCATRYQ